MRDSTFWRVIAILAIATGLCIGHGLGGPSDLALPDPLFARQVHAGGVSAMTPDTEYFVTASEDGRTVYVWEFNGARAPQYHSQAFAKQ